MAATVETVLTCELAGSWVCSESPTITMMNVAAMSSVAVSFARRWPKRITPSGARRAPTTITIPSTSSAFEKIDPITVLCATTASPWRRAKTTRKSSGRLPSVACMNPATPAPSSSPTLSTPTATTCASPASATVAKTNATIESHPP